MIAPLRARHLRLVSLVSLIALGGTLGALAVRQPPLTVAALPDALSAPTAADGASLLWEHADLWGEHDLLTRLTRAEGAARLELVPARDAPWGAGSPDVLLYATAGPVPEPAPNARLPEDAVLLGAFAGDPSHVYPLPAGHAGDGWLILYSLARNTVIDRARLPDDGGDGR
ncbi:MAG: hypothetical protein ACYTG2_14095 [Planctomycetota bacterium]